jgi:hypothetical protein
VELLERLLEELQVEVSPWSEEELVVVSPWSEEASHHFH